VAGVELAHLPHGAKGLSTRDLHHRLIGAAEVLRSPIDDYGAPVTSKSGGQRER
jgi:hypothetical protein